MTAVGQVWACVSSALTVLVVTVCTTVALNPHAHLGESLLGGLALGLILGAATFAGVYSVMAWLEEAQEIDKKNRDAYAAKVKEEYERLMREEERKARG